jgi:hypothetical protein
MAWHLRAWGIPDYWLRRPSRVFKILFDGIVRCFSIFVVELMDAGSGWGRKGTAGTRSSHRMLLTWRSQRNGRQTLAALRTDVHEVGRPSISGLQTSGIIRFPNLSGTNGSTLGTLAVETPCCGRTNHDARFRLLRREPSVLQVFGNCLKKSTLRSMRTAGLYRNPFALQS